MDDSTPARDADVTTRQRIPTPPQQRGWSKFAHRYGWRAYALPILVVVTVAALARGPGASHTKQPADVSHTNVAASGGRAATQSRGVDSGASSAPSHTDFEGLTGGDSGFQPGATPRAVVIHLKTDDGTSCATNTYPQLVLVSISKQHLWACQGTKQVNSSPVTTGKVVDNDQTPLGSWRVQAKQRDRYLVGPGYKDYVQYWLPFNGDFGLHDAPWQTMPFGGKDWRTQGSHGCVHTPTTVMAWIFHWATVGRTVVTIES